MCSLKYSKLFQIYELRVMETKPDKAVSIIECDMNVSYNYWGKCGFTVSLQKERASHKLVALGTRRGSIRWDREGDSLKSTCVPL